MVYRNNLKEWRVARGLTIEQLAEKLSVSGATISRIENGTQQPRTPLLTRIGKVFGTAEAQFFAMEEPTASGVQRVTMSLRKIPILDSVQAGPWTEVYPNLAEGAFQDFMLTERRYSERAFAMRVKGESMLPKFQEGDVVVVDPSHPPSPGSFVVATNGEGEATLKQYASRGYDERGTEIFELVPTNPLYASIRSDVTAIKILGTVRERTELFK